MLSHSSPPAHVRRVPRRVVLFLASAVAYTRFPGVQMSLLCTCNTGITVISCEYHHKACIMRVFLRHGFVITCTLLAKPAREFIQAVQHRTMRSGSPSRPFSTTTQDRPAGLPKTWISLSEISVFGVTFATFQFRISHFGIRTSVLFGLQIPISGI